MPYSSYISTSGAGQGEVSFTLKKEKVFYTHIDFVITSYSDKWQKIDLLFEYRLGNNYEWMSDASIIGSQSDYIQNNKLLGIAASHQGTENRFQWKFIDNGINVGMTIQLRLRMLPRIKTYSYDGATIISDAYGESFFDLEEVTNKKCIGKDLNGRYICVGVTDVSIYNSLSDTTPLYAYYNLSNPSFVKQLRNGKYIVADYGYNRILELDETLLLVRSNSVSSPIYLDFSELNNTLLVVSSGSPNIKEITWDSDYGNLVWQSNNVFSSVTSATYNRDNYDEIVVVDNGNDEIVLIDKTENSYTTIDKYRFINGTSEGSSRGFWNPYRAYFYNNDAICVVEKDGEELTFETLYSSSSSSIDSSSSSSSSSSTSSSSTSLSSSSSSSVSSSSSSSEGYTTSSSSSSSSSIG